MPQHPMSFRGCCRLIWLARLSHLNAERLGLGRDGLAKVMICSHLFDQSDAFWQEFVLIVFIDLRCFSYKSGSS